MFVIHHEIKPFDSKDIQGPVVSKLPIVIEMVFTLSDELTHPTNISHGHSLSTQIVPLSDLTVIVTHEVVNQQSDF